MPYPELAGLTIGPGGWRHGSAACSAAFFNGRQARGREGTTMQTTTTSINHRDRACRPLKNAALHAADP